MELAKLRNITAGKSDIVIDRDEFSIGRSRDNSLVVVDLEISRCHCVFKRNPINNKWTIIDKSSIGVRINCEKIDKNVPFGLENNMFVVLSQNYKYVFECPSMAPQSSVECDARPAKMPRLELISAPVTSSDSSMSAQSMIVVQRNPADKPPIKIRIPPMSSTSVENSMLRLANNNMRIMNNDLRIRIPKSLLMINPVVNNIPDSSTDNSNTSTDNANMSSNNANTSSNSANMSTSNANMSTNSANTSTNYANTSTNNANASTSNVNTSTSNEQCLVRVYSEEELLAFTDKVLDEERQNIPTNDREINNLQDPQDQEFIRLLENFQEEIISERIAEGECIEQTTSETSEPSKEPQQVTKPKDVMKVATTDSQPNTSKKANSSSESEQKRMQIVDDAMEDELHCSICTEFFIKPVTLNCSHTYCDYCILRWKQKSQCCPICRKPITSTSKTLVLESFINRIMEGASNDSKEHRKKMIEDRENDTTATSKTKAGPSGSNVTSTGSVATINLVDVSSSDSDMGEEEEEEDDEDEIIYDGGYPSDGNSWEEDFDDEYSDYNGLPGVYYGGYGRCYSCGQTGHWANGCPTRHRSR